MKVASRLLQKFSRRLFPEDQTSQSAFIHALLHPQSLESCILWSQPKPSNAPFLPEPALPWQPSFVDRVSPALRPGQHPLHDQGYYYCLDASSVFAASTLLNLISPGEWVVDLCAAPGGKSLFAWRALQPKLLISNEVIGKRLGPLIANLRRCQVNSAVVTRLDAQVFAQSLPATTPVVIVDAPCSGQSLLAKGGKAPGCFHPVTLNKNANRQKRILANAAQLVAPQGYLAYMTCTYAVEENEQVSAWLLERFPDLQPLPVPHLAAYQSHLSSIPCYRLWPQAGLGAGAFTILFKNISNEKSQPFPISFFQQPGMIQIGDLDLNLR